MTPDGIRYERIPWEPSPDGGGPLGRHLHHDERSRAFAVQPVGVGSMQSVTHRRLVPIYDQGQDVTVDGRVWHGLGSCTAHACKGCLSTQPFGHKYRAESGIVTWYEAVTKVDPYDGAFPPDDTGSDGLSNAKLALSRGLIGSFSHSFTLLEFLSGIQGVPAMIGVNWYDSMDRPDPDGLVRITPGASIRGGHEMSVPQLRLATTGTYAGTDRVRIPQSWGTGFGNAGWIEMELSTLDRLLHEDGDATFMLPKAYHAPQFPAPKAA